MRSILIAAEIPVTTPFRPFLPPLFFLFGCDDSVNVVTSHFRTEFIYRRFSKKNKNFEKYAKKGPIWYTIHPICMQKRQKMLLKNMQ